MSVDASDGVGPRDEAVRGPAAAGIAATGSVSGAMRDTAGASAGACMVARTGDGGVETPIASAGGGGGGVTTPADGGVGVVPPGAEGGGVEAAPRPRGGGTL